MVKLKWLQLLDMRLVAEGANIGNGTESSPCECINDCEVISFSTAISSSKMSTKTVLSAILNSSDVPGRFIAATETRHRVDASLMMQTVTLLTDTVETHRRLRSMIDSHVIVAPTSITTAMSKLLTSLGNMMRGHIADSLKTLNVLNDVYSKHVNYLATGLSTQLQECDSLTAEVHVIIIRAQSTVISSTQTDRLQLLHDRLEYLHMTLIDFDSMLDKAARNSIHQWHYFPDRLLIGDCNEIFENVNDSLQYHTEWLNYFIPTVWNVVPAVDAVIFTNMTVLRRNMISLSNCLLSYKEELTSFFKHLSKFTFRTDFNYEPPVTILSNFQSGGEWLQDIADTYIANLSSKKRLAEMFVKKGKCKVTIPADRLYSDIELSLFSKLSNLIDQQETNMVSFYSYVLQRVTSLQRYMFANDTALEEFMRRFSIWRMPAVNFQNSQVLGYKLLLCCYCVLSFHFYFASAVLQLVMRPTAVYGGFSTRKMKMKCVLNCILLSQSN